MTPEQMAEAVRINAGRAALEATGGLTFDRAREVAATGVDYLVGRRAHPLGAGPRHRAWTSVRLTACCSASTSATATRSWACSTTATVVDHWRVDDRGAPHRRRVVRAAPRPAARRPGRVARSPRRSGIAVCSTVPTVLHEVRADARALLRRRAAPGRRAGRAYRRAGADGQPARGRHRPDRQRAGRVARSTAARASSSTSAPPRPSTWSAPGASTSAAPSLPASRSRWRRSAGAAPSCAGSSWLRPRSVIAKNTVEALQSRRRLRLRLPGRRHRRPAWSRSSASTARRRHRDRHRRAGPGRARRVQPGRRARAVR